MADTVEFELVSPSRLLKSEPVEMVVVPGAEGDVGILPNHSPLICTVRPGVIKVMESGKVSEEIFVAGGFCEVSPERCTVLTEEAILVNDLNRQDAEERLRQAKEKVASATEHEIEEARKHLTLAEEMMAAIEYVERGR
ncbi:MAG: F0F1 ATP synthase subunit epsilon [Rhodospirillales bacterium]|nr:F0F1 ATP synthase subunit epsilon [Rhodospirillales bacterium]